MWQLVGCPRCKGDVYIDRDEYGWFRQCMQCGYVGNLEKPPKEPEMNKRKEPVKVQAGR